jgi:hypothetical protein
MGLEAVAAGLAPEQIKLRFFDAVFGLAPAAVFAFVQRRRRPTAVCSTKSLRRVLCSHTSAQPKHSAQMRWAKLLYRL